MNYSTVIKIIRDRLSLSKAELSRELNCTAKTVWMIETGRTKKPHLALQANIKKMLDKVKSREILDSWP
jgi:DNA-binding XRE family transcriptional regulator